MIGAAARALAAPRKIEIRFRRPRPHEHFAAPAGHRALIAIAITPDGPEECAWIAPERAAKQALNPRHKEHGRKLAAGRVPDGWQRP